MGNNSGSSDEAMSSSDDSVSSSDDSVSSGDGRVDVVGGVVDMGGLNNLLDGVDLVGGGNGNSTGNSDLVRSGHMLVHDDLTLDGNGNMDGDVNVVVLYIELGDD